MDIPYSGSSFTWSRGTCGDAVYEVLDKGLATIEWLNLFQTFVKRHIVSIKLDHCPFLFEIAQPRGVISGKMNFRFENFWVLHEPCCSVVTERWDSMPYSDRCSLVSKIKNCVDTLARWNRDEIDNFQGSIAMKENLLSFLNSISNATLVDTCKNQLENLYLQEEIL